MKSIALTDESYDFLTNLAAAIESQNNRATAKPYFFVIQTKKWRVAEPDYAHGETKVVRIDSRNDVREYHLKEDFVKAERCYDPDITMYDIEVIWDSLDEVTLESYEEEDNVFLTEAAFKNHVELNGHNLGRKGEYWSYLKHAFRNPGMNSLFKAIQEFNLKE